MYCIAQNKNTKKMYVVHIYHDLEFPCEVYQLFYLIQTFWFLQKDNNDHQ